VSLLGDRAQHHPFGIAGGGEGGLLEVTGKSADGPVGGPGIAKLRGVRLEPGDWIEVRMPGGGGYGPPADRPDELLARDLDLGYVTPEALETKWNRPDPRSTSGRG